MKTRPIRTLAVVLGLLLVVHAAPEGEFRFLTDTLPEGTTNGEYASTLLTANAAGPVTYGIGAGELPTGLSIDPATGDITGLPTEVRQFDVTFTADDGVETIQFVTTMKINASGGGGNSGASLALDSLDDGRVGEEYSATLGILNGVGPYLFGSIGLPPGLRLNGRTGEISGIPATAGTFFLTISITDRGENDNKVITIMPLTVLPADSDFRFTTVLLDNGEVGSAYHDQLLTADGTGAITYSATGLPAGLAIDEATGEISGDPTTAGLFEVFLTAEDQTASITTNRRIWIVPASTSHFYWDYFGVPAAIYNVRYDRTPPILVAAKGAVGAVSYSAIGLPEGMDYDPLSGELRGTAVDVGVYPATFQAVDGGNGETLVLPTDFIVLPAGGGDAREIPVNLWICKQVLKTGRPGRDKWKGTYLYNADRRADRAFDPETDVLQLSIGARIVTLDPESLVRARGSVAVYRTREEDGTRIKAKVIGKKQIVKLATARDTISETLPGTLRGTLILGGRGYRLDEFVEESGRFIPTFGFRSTAFVTASMKMRARAAGEDTALLKLLLGDPGFTFTTGDTLHLRIISGDETLVDKEFTDLVEGSVGTYRKTGATTYSLQKTADDPAETVRLLKFKYDSRTGKALLSLAGLDLSGLPADEAHLGVELTVGEKTVFTTLTVFESRPGRFSTRGP